jgi:site-specific recombinase XerD
MLFVNAIEKYLEWKATYAASAANRYAVRLYQFAKFLGETKLLKEVTGDDVIRFHRYLESAWFKKGNLMNGYSKATIAYSATILKNFFMFWAGRRKSNVNPKEILRIRHAGRLKKVIGYDEFKTMSDSLDEGYFDELEKKLVINMLWDTGMRISELSDLNIGDISGVHPKYGVRTAQTRTRKAVKYNLVVWSKQTDKLLNKYLGVRLCSKVWTDALFIVGRKSGAQRASIRTLQRWIRDMVFANELNRGITAHSFRHGKAHAMLENGANVPDIQAVLRHIRPESTYHYLTLNADQYLKVASKYLDNVQVETPA